MSIFFFCLYSAFCFWVIFMDGADRVEGWQSVFLFGWFPEPPSTSLIKFSVAVSWFTALLVLIIGFLYTT